MSVSNWPLCGNRDEPNRAPFPSHALLISEGGGQWELRAAGGEGECRAALRHLVREEATCLIRYVLIGEDSGCSGARWPRSSEEGVDNAA
jgi:hypothetical protein